MTFVFSASLPYCSVSQLKIQNLKKPFIRKKLTSVKHFIISIIDIGIEVVIYFNKLRFRLD